MGEAGVEPARAPCNNKHLQQSIDEKAQKKAVSDDKTASELPSDLAEIVAVWPELPEHIRAAIKALVQTHNSKGA